MDLIKWAKTITGIAIAGGIIVGFKFYRRFQVSSDIQQKLVAVCADNSDCVKSVNRHFEACFHENYDWGNRRRLGHLKGEKFVTCIHQKAGKDFTPQAEN